MAKLTLKHLKNKTVTKQSTTNLMRDIKILSTHNHKSMSCYNTWTNKRKRQSRPHSWTFQNTSRTCSKRWCRKAVQASRWCGTRMGWCRDWKSRHHLWAVKLLRSWASWAVARRLWLQFHCCLQSRDAILHPFTYLMKLMLL